MMKQPGKGIYRQDRQPTIPTLGQLSEQLEEVFHSPPELRFRHHQDILHYKLIDKWRPAAGGLGQPHPDGVVAKLEGLQRETPEVLPSEQIVDAVEEVLISRGLVDHRDVNRESIIEETRRLLKKREREARKRKEPVFPMSNIDDRLACARREMSGDFLPRHDDISPEAAFEFLCNHPDLLTSCEWVDDNIVNRLPFELPKSAVYHHIFRLRRRSLARAENWMRNYNTKEAVRERMHQNHRRLNKEMFMADEAAFD